MAEPYNPNFPVPKGYAQVTVTTSSQSINQLLTTAAWYFTSIPAGTRGVTLQPEGDIRWRDDGVAPTATVGMKIVTNQGWVYGGDASLIRLIASGNTVLNIYFEG